MKKLLCLLLVAFSLTATAQKKVIESKTSFAKDVLQPYVESGELPGAISIFYNNGVQETCCIGYANVEQKRPIGLDNVYMQCSQTKGFCGVTIAKLVEEGKISLDDPVSKYLPEFKELWVQESDKDGVKVLRKAKNVLTVRMVLNHTGGFPFECSAKRADVRGGGWSGGAPLRQIASIAAGSPIMFEPGTRDLYSNTGIDIGAAGRDYYGTGWTESERNLVLSKAIQEKLESIGATVIPNRTTMEEMVTQRERIQFLIEQAPDYCLCIHHNSSEDKGREGYETGYFTSFSQDAADHIQKETEKTGLYREYREIWFYYYVSRQTACPIVLTENGFMTHPYDVTRMLDEESIAKKADAMVQGIVNYYLELNGYPLPGEEAPAE